MSARQHGFYLHVAKHVPGEQAVIARRLAGIPVADLETLPPPDGCEFVDGDFMARVTGNDVITCQSGLHESALGIYIRGMVQAAGLPDGASNFQLIKRANLNTIRLLQTEGVKKVKLSASLYQTTMERERRTISSGLLGSVGSELRAFLFRDPRLAEVDALENLSVEVSISYDRRKSGVVDAQRISHLANAVVEEEDNDELFEIETLKGKKVKQNELVLMKKARLTPIGKSVSHIDAWDKIDSFHDELRVQGALDQ